METTTVIKPKKNIKYINICVVDSSIIFAIGLKNNIEKSLYKTCKNLISYYQSMHLITNEEVPSIDMLFVDYEDVIKDDFKKRYALLVKKNPSIQLIVSSNDILNIDFSVLYSYSVNGLFPKRMNAKAFRIYLRKIYTEGSYIDYSIIGNTIEIEKILKLRRYFKSVSLHNLDLINFRQQQFLPFAIKKPQIDISQELFKIIKENKDSQLVEINPSILDKN